MLDTLDAWKHRGGASKVPSAWNQEWSHAIVRNKPGVTGAAGNTSRVQPLADCSDTPAGRYVIWYLHLELDRAA